VTLRLRLLLLSVGIVVAGLVISDVVTYNALRSFLTNRVDLQLEQAAYPVGRALLSSSGLGQTVPAAPPFHGTGAGEHNGYRSFDGLLGGTQRGLLVDPGTYGQLRSSTGRVEAHLFFSYGGKAPAAPAIPVHLPGSGLPATESHFFTTSSSGPNSVTYRALARPLADGSGTVVVAVPLTDLEGTLNQLLLIELIVSAVLLLGLSVVSWLMVRRDLRPLEEITETAGVIARGDLSQRVSHVAEGTEVGQLGVAFNTMVDEIEVAFAERAASEERLRRFLADASHELRTPLTSILGYAELFDLGVRDRPEDLATSLRHIRAEASRMETLVDDLLWLAKLDHERPLGHDLVDLAELAHLSAAAIEVSAPERTVRVAAGSPVLVVGDDQRLRQVIDNLLVNATVHTPSGTPVEVTVSEVEGSAILTVHDDGPGVDPGEEERIFQPFYRSDPSRARTSGGSGLGLAIVHAIVLAHGGSVAVTPGPGATFEVTLPIGHPTDDAAAAVGEGGEEGRSGGDVPDRSLDDLSGADARSARIQPLG